MADQADKNRDFAVFEVFSQKNSKSPFVHQFSLLASDHEMAMALARENFLRRDTCINLWVVKRDDIYALPPEDRESLQRMDNKDYRETKGYAALQARWRYHKEQYEKKQQRQERSEG